MSRFFVGQRVRIVSATARPELVGIETRITAVAPAAWASAGYDWLIDIVDDGQPLGACSHNLEPILPEGAAPSEFTTLADLLNSLDMTVPA